MLQRIPRLALAMGLSAFLFTGCNDAGMFGVGDKVDTRVSSERGSLNKFNFTSVQNDIKKETFTICKMAPEDPNQPFTFTTTFVKVNNNASDPTIISPVDLLHGECEDMAVSNSTAGDIITITETIPAGWNAKPDLEVWNIDQAGVITPMPHAPDNFIEGQVTEFKDGCLVIFHNSKLPTPPGGGQGCTPGYWKNNWSKKGGVSWGPTGIAGGDALSTVGFSGFTAVDGDATSFIDALKAGGGGQKALMRHAAAAVLNAAHPDVSYDETVADIVAMVNAALAGGDVEGTKNVLANFNEQGCSIDQQGRVKTSTTSAPDADKPKRKKPKRK